MVKCTACSQEVRPVVAIDIDGTLGNYHGHFTRFALQYLGKEGISEENAKHLRIAGWPKVYDGSCGFRDWFCVAYGINVATWNDIKLAYRLGAQKRSQPPIDNVIDLQEFNRALVDLGVEVWITTTRPHLSLDRIDRDTRSWLEKYRIHHYGLLYDDDKYHVLANRVDPSRVIFVMDDLPEMYDAASALFGQRVPHLRLTTWNRGVSRPNYISTLGQVRQVLQSRILEWRANHV